MMVSNLRIQATITTLPGLPACLRRSANALMFALQLMAETVAMYKTARTSARPPQTKRLPQPEAVLDDACHYREPAALRQ